MSVNITAYTVLGCQFSMKDLTTTTPKRGCNHRPAGVGAKFCSECGKPIWADSMSEPDWANDFIIDGLDIVHLTDDVGVVVGRILGKVKDIECGGGAVFSSYPLMIMSNITDVRDRLDKNGLLNSSNFGLWTVGCVS
jgi:hypothetical protein